ncbi:MAG TPA: serine hydrolase domain-containing protein [Intrasporangium sp.]|nr:serine hydrolase domain-containing protein [Intrasporangium sp.]
MVAVDDGDLAALLSDHAQRHSVPGAALGIVRDGTVSVACHGVADVRLGEPVTRETRFAVGSLTKSMVATVLARLAEAGRLSLDDPAVAHVPELVGSEWIGAATLRDLLANRSRLPLRAHLEFDFDGRRDESVDALSRMAAEIGDAGPPMDFWSYTNAGWNLLGRAIEGVTGLAWEDAMTLWLAEPGLRETSFGPSSDHVGRASGHTMTAAGPVPVEPLRGLAYGPAGVGTVSTVTDLLRFATLHLEDPALAALRVVHASQPIHAWLDEWCLGWARFDWVNGQAWGWDGLVNGERSLLRILPEQHAAVALLTNSSSGRALGRSIFAELMESLFGIGVPPLRLGAVAGAAGDLSRFAGVYAWPDRRLEVTVTGPGLTIRSEGGAKDALPVDERTFVVDAADPDNPTVTFADPDAAGRPRLLYVMLWGLPRAGADDR